MPFLSRQYANHFFKFSFMELAGRLTANAVVKEIAEGRKVVNFTLAVNNGYKKNGEWVEKTVFIDCSYWIGIGIAEFMTKGRRVEIFGEIGVQAYINASRAAVGKLTFHVIRIKLGDKPKSSQEIGDRSEEPVKDLSF
jgi:single-strand DNA-binding protein